MDSDTKSMLKTIVSIVIGGAIVYYLFYKPSIQLQQSNQLQLQQFQQNQLQQFQQNQLQQQIRQQEYQQYQQTQPLSLSSNYKNAEKWAISRNKDGFISNIEVIRDAKVS